MFSKKRQLGNKGEEIVAKHLEQKGFKILAKNYLKKGGEIDIIAVKKQGIFRKKIKLLIFVEVKTRLGNGYDIKPEDNFNAYKLRKITRVIPLFLLEHKIPMDVNWRVDLITVGLSKNNIQKPRIRHYKNLSSSFCR